MAEPAEADDADFFAGARLPVLQRRVGSDAGAEQGRGGGEVKIFRQREGEGLVDDDVIAVAAEGDVAVLVFGVVGEDGRMTIAVLLLAGFAGGTGAAGVDHAADGGVIADLEFLDRGADFA